ncbi:MAG: 30S ribosomal protein S17 [Candidatus Omnitrophota bacterium]
MKKDCNVRKKEITGTVISDKMDKCVTVMWETRKKHPVYKKYITWHKKIKARDVKNEASVGDTVKITETRPLSKEKTWRVVGIVEKAQKE